MSEPLPLRAGGCLCGAVRFAARPGPHMDVCHCGMCRRWSGGVFMAVPVTELTIEDGSPLGAYASSDYGERAFCRNCGSSLFWRMRDGSSAAASLQAFDDLSGIDFAEEIFIDDKPALYSFADDTAKLTGAEFVARVSGQEQAGG
ncbi:GFA family protein [Methylopila musalis]|uniref:GFA family protein n=1 Tax=Methylopila musalis TaxID=1134781 RepID=A0ABW3Z9I7_9HYPH